MKKEFTLTIFSEKQEELINKIALIFTRRKININSFSVVFCKAVNLYRFTITILETESAVQNIVHQMEKIIEVYKCFLQTKKELFTHQIVLLKFMNSDSEENQIETLISLFPFFEETHYSIYASKIKKETVLQLRSIVNETELITP